MVQQLQPWPLVKKGEAGHPVKTLQYLLRARGHAVAADGYFGPKTDAAVRAFQGEKNLAVDGVVGPRTWRALVVLTRRGDTGDAVRGVQEEFNYRTGDPGHPFVVDGIFGPKTEDAVRGYQSALSDVPGMTVDGIVGPVTWQALVSGMLNI